ncbi:MAG TPA: DedA family protein [bacterium]|jgi:membrane-associated protein
MPFLLDLFLHLDRYLGQIISEYGTLTYLILFITVFCETGLVVTPFLPGDSLLFAAGTFAALGSLDLSLLLVVLYLAPILGDSCNYWIGRYLGPKVFSKEGVRFLNKQNLEKTHAFYEKHGGKAVIIARFMPIFRTFAPFVAGIGRMNYLRFLTYSVGGTLLWISCFVLAGYFFGNIPFVKKNFSVAIMAIILISMLPAVFEYIKHRKTAKAV